MNKKIVSVVLAMFLMLMNAAIGANIEEPYIIEHLPDYKKTNTSMVKITADSAVLMQNNVIQISLNSYFNSKNAKKGDIVDFSLPNGLHTIEGRCLLPSCTKITGCILDVEKPKMFNRSAKVYILFNEIVLPNGCTLPLTAYPADENKALKVAKWKTAGKAALYTIGFFGAGSGLGGWIGSASHSAGKGALAFGMPIGAGVGLIIGVLTPGLHYKAKSGTIIYIKLDDCLVVPLASISQ